MPVNRQNQALALAEYADLARIGIERDLGIVHDIEIGIDQRLAVRSIRQLVRPVLIIREVEVITGGNGLLPLGDFSSPVPLRMKNTSSFRR